MLWTTLALPGGLAALLVHGHHLVAAGSEGTDCPDDCSLNGKCVEGVCQCDVPWTGPSCGRFLTAPAKPGGIYGFAPNVSSWGGSLVTDANGTHHLYAAEIPGGLTQWATKSQCIHATSADLQGPFTLKDVALKPWCHGPQVVLDPVSSHYIMTHVGTGVPKPPSPACLKTNTCAPAPDGPCPAQALPGWRCYPGVCGADGDAKMGRCGRDLAEPNLTCADNNLSSCAAAAAKQCELDSKCGGFSLAKIWNGLGKAKLFAHNTTRVPTTGWTTWVHSDQSDSMAHEQKKWQQQQQHDEANGGSAFMHHASSPNGPWLPATTSPGGCGMPSAAFHPNGTLFVICGNGHAITRVVSPASTPVWDATWSPQVRLTPTGLQGNWEDPDLWFDKHGNFHILYHIYTLAHDYRIERCSGHAWSRDGIEWSYSQEHQPFNCTVAFTDGSSRAFATRERPHLVFVDKTRTTPVAVISAVSSQPVGPSCNTCHEQACSQCKITPGRDWTYTMMQPFTNFPR